MLPQIGFLEGLFYVVTSYLLCLGIFGIISLCIYIHHRITK
jgi:hypothetical protein